MTVHSSTDSWHWVRSDAELQAVLQATAEAPFLAIDTEFRRRDTFYPEVALLQVSSGITTWLIDPLQVNDLVALRTFLSGGDRLRVLHSASEDLEVFEHWLGCLPEPRVDTQKAAAMLGLGFGLSYRDLVAELLGITLDKEETQSDWLARPLSAAQCQYAARDVIYLAECWPLLQTRAEERGTLAWIIEESGAMTTGGKGPLARFKSAWKLAPREQAVLAALVAWREEQARQRDKPRNWILQDKVISALAKKRPNSVAQLSAVDGMPPGVVRRSGKRLLEVVASADEQPTPVLPRPVGSEARAVAKQLLPDLASIAASLEMSPEILMSVRDLEALVAHEIGETDRMLPQWSGWRRDAVVQPLKARIRKLVGT